MSAQERGEAKHGGVLVRVSGALHFVPASAAVKIAAIPQIARVPGGPPELLGIALVEGDILPIVAIGPARAQMLVCAYLGERIGLVGLEVAGTGCYEADGGGVRHEGQVARPLDLATIYAQVQSGPWAGRWQG